MVGKPCDNTIPENIVVFVKVVCVIRGRVGGTETDVKTGLLVFLIGEGEIGVVLTALLVTFEIVRVWILVVLVTFNVVWVWVLEVLVTFKVVWVVAVLVTLDIVWVWFLALLVTFEVIWELFWVLLFEDEIFWEICNVSGWTWFACNDLLVFCVFWIYDETVWLTSEIFWTTWGTFKVVDGSYWLV